MAYNEKKTLAANMAAMEIAYRIDREKRKATTFEETLLKEYMGFGGSRSILLDPDKVEQWKDYNKPLIPLVKQLHQIVREYSENETAYKKQMESLKSSTLTGFYTPEDFISTVGYAIYNATGKLPERILEPSAGVGRFLHLFDNIEGAENIRRTAYELDVVTGKILKALEPDTDVRIQGFETLPEYEQGKYDMVVSNIPFGNVQVFDKQMSLGKDAFRKEATKKIHNYFFVKGLDALKEGGLLVYLTTSNFAETEENRSVREYMVKHADLISGIRLYSDIFRDEGIYDINTDLLVFRKNSRKKELSEDEKLFVETQDYKLEKRNWRPNDDEMYIDFKKTVARNLFFNKPYDIFQDVSNKQCLGYPTEDLDRFGKTIVSWSQDDYDEDVEKERHPYPKWWELQDFLIRDFGRNWRELEISEEVEDGIGQDADGDGNEDMQEVQTDKAAEEVMSLYDLFGLTAEERTQIKMTGKRRKNRKSAPVNLSPVPKVTLPQGERKFEAKGYPYYHYKGGTLASDLGQLGIIEMREAVMWFVPLATEMAQQEKDILHAYVQLRNAYWNLFDQEKEEGKEQQHLRFTLNNEYENLMKVGADLRSARMAALCGMDPHYTEIAGLERYENGQKILADIFREPVVFSKEQEPDEMNPQEALASSLNLYGEVKMDYMTEKTGMGLPQLVAELKEQIYLNPVTEEYEHAGKMIAGNIYVKMDNFQPYIDLWEGEKMTAEQQFRLNEMKRTMEALQNNVPAVVPFEELDFNLGERWIPEELYSDFVSKLTKSDMNVKYIPAADTFNIHGSYNYSVNVEWRVMTDHFTKDFSEVLRYAMEDNVPDFEYKVYDYSIGSYVTRKDDEAIQICSQKIEALKDRFYQYLESLPVEKKDELALEYNRRFNALVRPHYDGSCQTFPGLSFDQFDYKELYPSQKDAIWMIKQNRGGICDHQVGAGKTMIMCVAAHEMKRLGLAHKPMIIALKANVAEIAATYQKAYPDARVLYPSKKDFEPTNRVALFRDIQNNNYDCVILSHEQFKKIPQSMDVQRILMQQEIDEIEHSLRVLEEQQGRMASGRMYSGMEQRKKNLKVKLETLVESIKLRQDDEVDFRSMGIDHILVDESHEFKNLMVQTRHQRVAGLGNTQGSQRSANLLVAIRDIQMRTGRDLGATFLSGTTISNSLTELYVLFKYLRPQALAEQKISCFDAWAAIFTRKSMEFEFNVTNNIVTKERFRYFVKVPELALFYNEITDYRTADMIGIDRPEKNAIFRNIPPTPEQEAYLPKLMEFANSGDVKLLGGIKPPSDNIKAKMLVATNYSNKMALDMRLIDPYLYASLEGGKVDMAAQSIAEYYRKFDKQKGTQFVFSDLGVFKKGEWNVYSAIKDKLVEEYGIPENEIAFIQQYDTDKKRTALFKDMNEGNVRVLFGNTKSLGTGVNAQRRAVALHHLDTPWRPSDLEQREGRAVRKGNVVAKEFAGNKVDVITYATEKSLDAYKFNLLQNKQNFINQLKCNQLGARSIDEGGMDESTGVSFAEYVAVLSGNTDLLERAKLDKIIKQKERDRVLYNRETLAMERTLKNIQQNMQDNGSKRKDMKNDYDYYLKHKEEGFRDLSGNPLYGKEMVSFVRKGIASVETGGMRILGKYCGFDVKVMRNGLENAPRMGMMGAVTVQEYKKDNGIIPRSNDELIVWFDRVLGEIPERIGGLEEYYRKYEKEIEEISETLKHRNWPGEEELKRLKKEAEELDVRIKETLDANKEKGKEWKEDAEDAQVVTEEHPVAEETAVMEVLDLKSALAVHGFSKFDFYFDEMNGWCMRARTLQDEKVIERPLTEEERKEYFNTSTEKEVQKFILTMALKTVTALKEEESQKMKESITQVTLDLKEGMLKAVIDGTERKHHLSDEELRILAVREADPKALAVKVFNGTSADEKLKTGREKPVFDNPHFKKEQKGMFKFVFLKCLYKGMPLEHTITGEDMTKFLNRELTMQNLCCQYFDNTKLEKKFNLWKAEQTKNMVLTDKSSSEELKDWYMRFMGNRVNIDFGDSTPKQKGTVVNVIAAQYGDYALVDFKLDGSESTNRLIMNWKDQYAIEFEEKRVEEQDFKTDVEEEPYKMTCRR